MSDASVALRRWRNNNARVKELDEWRTRCMKRIGELNKKITKLVTENNRLAKFVIENGEELK